MSDLSQFDDVPIESCIKLLATSETVPILALGVCVIRIKDAAPYLLDVLSRAAEGEGLEYEDAELLFRGVHILGGARVTEACPLLLRMLRRPGAEVMDLLGPAVAQGVPRIIAGVFDGDAPALLAACTDPASDENVRAGLLGGATYATWEGKIERAEMHDALQRIGDTRPWADADVAWLAWLDAVGLLGFQDLATAAEGVVARHDPTLASMGRLREILADAIAAPDDVERFKSVGLGLIDDILVALEEYPSPGVGEDDGWPAPEPIRNPLRNVGRNDPCPCGSGRKYKKCCLPA